MQFWGFMGRIMLVFKIWGFAEGISDLWGLKLVSRFFSNFQHSRMTKQYVGSKKRFGSARMVRVYIAMPCLMLLGR